jgi:hypothetical protein
MLENEYEQVLHDVRVLDELSDLKNKVTVDVEMAQLKKKNSYAQLVASVKKIKSSCRVKFHREGFCCFDCNYVQVVKSYEVNICFSMF